MTLQELFVQLRTHTPNRRQFIWIGDIEDWIIDIDEPTNSDIVGVIARSECEVEDKFRDRDGVFIGTTTSLAEPLQEFTLEQIDADLETVFKGIDSFRAIVSCD